MKKPNDVTPEYSKEGLIACYDAIIKNVDDDRLTNVFVTYFSVMQTLSQLMPLNENIAHLIAMKTLCIAEINQHPKGELYYYLLTKKIGETFKNN